MRFVQAAVLLSTVIPFVSALPCDGFIAGNCQSTSVTADGSTTGVVLFPDNLVGTGGGDGREAILPPFVDLPSCSGDPAVIRTSVSDSKYINIEVVNDECSSPKATTMTKIHAANLITYLSSAFSSPANPCVARYDSTTGELTCIQTCADDVAYVCYLGVGAVIGLKANPTGDEQDCNADANLVAAGNIPVQPTISGLGFSSTADANQLDVKVTAHHYKARLPPKITVGSNCNPIAGHWAASSVDNVGTVPVDCQQDWTASFNWAVLHTADCYTGNSEVTINGDNFQKFDYDVTIVETDELYIRPLDDKNLASYRTTTTTQSFSLYAKETASDDVEFRAFDYSNVVSLVTSVSMSVDSSHGTVIVEVYSTVQYPFMFESGTNTWMNVAKGGSENWGVAFDAASGSSSSEDDGGDTDLQMRFILSTTTSGCTMSAGSFHYTQHVVCNNTIDPSDCPIPGSPGYEALTVTVNVPAIDLCPDSSSTDLTATLYVFGSSSYEDRQAFFTYGRAQDYVYVLAVLDSSQISIPNCGVIAASADMQGAGAAVDLLAIGSSAADWSIVYEDKASSYPDSTSVGFQAPAGSCLSFYKFKPVSSLFNVPYDSSKQVTLTLTIGVEIPSSKKRNVNLAQASAAITLSNTQSDDPSSDSSDASNLVANAVLAAAGCFAALMF